MKVSQQTQLLQFLILFVLLTPASCLTGQGGVSQSRSRAALGSPTGTYRDLSSQLDYRRNDDVTMNNQAESLSKLEAVAASDSVTSSNVGSPLNPIELPAKQSQIQADALLDAEIAIGRIFMAAAVVLLAGELFTDLSVSQLLMTMFVSH